MKSSTSVRTRKRRPLTSVSHEVERPAQITPLRYGHWCSCAESPLATAALAHGQPFPFVEAIGLLAIEPDALALQHQAKTPIAEPPSLSLGFTNQLRGD